MNTTQSIRNGLTYTLAGQTITVHATRSSDKVGAIRVALAKGGTDLTLYTNGRAYQA